MTRTISTDKARQGNRGRPVLLVLAASLVLLFIGWGAVEFFGEEIDRGVDQRPQGQVGAPDPSVQADTPSSARP